MEPEELQKALEERLPGADVQIERNASSGKISGYFVHDSFRGQSHVFRQQQLWEFLRQTFGPRSVEVGMIFTYTPEEFDSLAEGEEAV